MPRQASGIRRCALEALIFADSEARPQFVAQFAKHLGVSKSHAHGALVLLRRKRLVEWEAWRKYNKGFRVTAKGELVAELWRRARLDPAKARQTLALVKVDHNDAETTLTQEVKKRRAAHANKNHRS